MKIAFLISPKCYILEKVYLANLAKFPWGRPKNLNILRMKITFYEK